MLIKCSVNDPVPLKGIIFLKKSLLAARLENCERRLLASICVSVRPSVHRNNQAVTGWIFMKFDLSVISINLSIKFKCP